MTTQAIVDTALAAAEARLAAPRFTVTLLEERDKHYYTIDDGPRLPGVTGILGVIAKPALIPWAKKEALKVVEAEILDKMKGQAAARISVNTEWLEALIKKAKARPDKIKDDAADVGTRAHRAIDFLIKGMIVGGLVGKDVEPDIDPAYDNFCRFMKTEGITFIAGDTKVASRKHGFGGSLDWLAIDRAGKIVLGDIKTSNGIWPEYGAQLGGYAIGLEERFGIKADRGVIIRLGKEDAEYEQGEITDMEAARCAFIDAKNLKQTIEDKTFIKKTKENKDD